jgi:hypothetical protein
MTAETETPRQAKRRRQREVRRRRHTHRHSAQTIGLAVIAKDEEATLPRLLAAIEGAFDQVALLDTGSQDRTVEVFEKWSVAEKLRQPVFVSILDHFEWCDDFAAARNLADDLLATDWLCWADCDDVIHGATALRGLLDSSDGVAYEFPYLLGAGRDPIWRDRLRRRGDGRWAGRLHESLHIQVVRTPEDISWKHLRPDDRELGRSLRRDQRVLRRWVEDEPRNLRPLGMLAWTELMHHGHLDRALGLLSHYIATRWDDPCDEVAVSERDTAEWALSELEWTCRNLDGEAYLRAARSYLVTIIGRRPAAVWSATTVCAEDELNPETDFPMRARVLRG